jgi:hypothetical protein
VRCPRCGNDNQDGMRFCGMCGGTLLPAAPPAPARPDRGVSPAPQSSAPATATATRPPELPRPPQNTAGSSPSISGPSFLGLNDAPPAGKRAQRSDSHSSSRNLDYLLQDEEEHRGGSGAGKFFLIVLALALAVGFGYLRFKDQLPWLTPGAKKPAPSAQNPDQAAGDSSSPTPSSGTPESQPTSNPPAANPPAANAPAANTPAASTPAANTPGASPEPAPSNSAAATPNTQPTGDAAANVQPNSSAQKSADNAESANNSPSSDSAANKPSQPAAKSDESSEDNESDAAPAEAAPKPKPVRPTAKPQAASKPVDSVAEAQRYLYGRGAAQDCDHGLRLLKPLANQGNAKAMVEMGALYSAGLCTPRDLPTSYRWFAIALRKDPSNQTIQTDLQKLWGEMTQPERQLAIKLTQ